MIPSEPRGSDGRPTYRRSRGSARGQARRQDLLTRVTDDLEANGLVDFSLRRAARAAETTHKVLLYYFDDVDDLTAQALMQLRHRRIDAALKAAITQTARRRSLSGRVRLIWDALADAQGGLRVLDQASGLAMYDPPRYARLGREATEQYLPSLVALCPETWAAPRKQAVAAFILATLRGLLVDLQTGGDIRRINAALEILLQAVEREEAAARPPGRPTPRRS